jgi:maleamate amidohydrolase
MLLGYRVDTTIVVGCSTSGCIRATCESAFNYNFHVIVPEEAVGDRSSSAHDASLFDIDARFGDVMPLREVATHLTARYELTVGQGQNGHGTTASSQEPANR